MATPPDSEMSSHQKCAAPSHVGPVRIVNYWGKAGQYRSRVCEHCGMQWRERMLRFGRRGTVYWRRAILSLEDLDPPTG
jgi:hypothetical protein